MAYGFNTKKSGPYHQSTQPTQPSNPPSKRRSGHLEAQLLGHGNSTLPRAHGLVAPARYLASLGDGQIGWIGQIGKHVRGEVVSPQN